MKLTQKKRILFFVGILFISTSCAVCAFVLLFPPMITTYQLIIVSPKHTSHAPKIASIKKFETLWSRDLQKDVIDAPPPPVPEKKIPPLPIVLVGTAADSKNPKSSQAFFTVNGSSVMACQGEKIGTDQAKAEILEINSDSVKLLYFEKTIVLKIQE